MQAIRANSFGGPEVLELEEVPTPVPAPGQILIRVNSAAVNFSDIMRRRNDLYPFPTTLPYIPGGEVAGAVEALGAGVDGPAVGTRVFSLVGGDGSTGYAQLALADAAQVIPTPEHVSDDEASAIVIAGSTAVLALHEVAKLLAGETILIEGAGGWVGGFAVQLAALAGATVIGIASTAEGRETAIALGATIVVDPADPDWVDEVRGATGGKGVDVAWHIGGAATFEPMVSVLAPFGRVIVAGRAGGASLTMTPDLVDSLFYRPSLGQSIHVFNLGLYFGLKPEVAVGALRAIIGHVASGAVKVPIGQVAPLREAAEVHRQIESREATGKVILKPWAE